MLLSAATTYEAGLSDRDQALKYLQQAFVLGLPLKDAQRSFALKDLRKDPRYAAMEKAAVNQPIPNQ
jgi:hypothetical protein